MELVRIDHVDGGSRLATSPSGSGRPSSLDMDVMPGVLEDVPRRDAGAMVRVRQVYQLAPLERPGVVELRMPQGTLPMATRSGGERVRHAVEGSRLLVERPAGSSSLAVESVSSSLGGAPIDVTDHAIRIHDLALRVVGGDAEIRERPFGVDGVRRPDTTQVLIRMDDPSWRLTDASAARLGADYRHRHTGVVQSHFELPRSEPFSATFERRGLVGRFASAGPMGDARRGISQVVDSWGAVAMHALGICR